VKADVETRYMRSDTIALDVTYFKLLTNNTDSYGTQSEAWQTTSRQSQGYLRFLIYVFHSNYSFNLIATSSSIAVSGSTPTLYQANVSVPLTSLTITDRVYVQTQYSPNNSTWTSLASARFITEELGGNYLLEDTWTFRVYAAFESVYNIARRRWVNTIYLYFGDSTYPSRIENFIWTTTPPPPPPPPPPTPTVDNQAPADSNEEPIWLLIVPLIIILTILILRRS